TFHDRGGVTAETSTPASPPLGWGIGSGVTIRNGFARSNAPRAVTVDGLNAFVWAAPVTFVQGSGVQFMGVQYLNAVFDTSVAAWTVPDLQHFEFQFGGQYSVTGPHPLELVGGRVLSSAQFDSHNGAALTLQPNAFPATLITSDAAAD